MLTLQQDTNTEYDIPTRWDDGAVSLDCQNLILCARAADYLCWGKAIAFAELSWSHSSLGAHSLDGTHTRITSHTNTYLYTAVQSLNLNATESGSGYNRSHTLIIVPSATSGHSGMLIKIRSVREFQTGESAHFSLLLSELKNKSTLDRRNILKARCNTVIEHDATQYSDAFFKIALFMVTFCAVTGNKGRRWGRGN